MRNAFLAFALLPLFAAACGVGASQSHGGPGPGPTPEDGGVDANNGCSSQPEPVCRDCEGNPVAPTCENGEYGCPLYGCPIPPPPEPDGGCNYPYSCPAFCSAICQNDQWSCACPIWDASPDAPFFPDSDPVDVWVPQPDAGPDGEAPFFACGNQGCETATSYCQVTTGGPVVDAGPTGFECIALPSTCPVGGATCACVQAVQGIGCGCVESGGEVTITCEIP
jgi:hypothetical protein